MDMIGYMKKRDILMQQVLDKIKDYVSAAKSTDTLTVSARANELIKLAKLRSSESLKYIDLQRFFAANFQFDDSTIVLDKGLISASILPEAIHSHLVFVDGKFSSELSDVSAYKDIDIQSLASCSHQKQTFLSEIEEDLYALFNRSLATHAHVIKLSDKSMHLPLQILHVFSGKKDLLALMPRLHIHLEENAQLQIMQTYVSLDTSKSCWLNPYLTISLEKRANVNLYTALFAESHDWCFETIRAQVKESAQLEIVGFSMGGITSRSDIKIDLLQPHASAFINNVSFTCEDHHQHTRCQVGHYASETLSRQLSKVVVADSSFTTNDGMIYVAPKVEKIDSYQLNKNIILDNQAKAYSRPNLSIYSDDVKASHGATTSNLSDEFLFYFSTRGISKNQAKKLFLFGFFEEILGLVKISGFRDKVNRALDKFLDRFST